MCMATPSQHHTQIQDPLVEGGCIGLCVAYVTGGPRRGGFLFYREVANGH